MCLDKALMRELFVNKWLRNLTNDEFQSVKVVLVGIEAENRAGENREDFVRYMAIEQTLDILERYLENKYRSRRPQDEDA